MMLPLMLLAVGAIFAGLLNFPSERLADFLSHSPSLQNVLPAAPVEGEPHPLFPPVMIVSALISIAGILLAYVLHLKNRAADDRLVERFAPLARLLEGKYWVDEIYQAYIVGPLWAAGEIFFAVDRFVVDGLVWIVSFIPQLTGFTIKRTTQRGYLQGYAASMLFGVAIILLIIFV